MNKENEIFHAISEVKKEENNFESVLFLTKVESRRGEGGLRMQGHFKKSYPNKPLVSIITVVFNNELYLEETIKSVINQNYKNFEYIIIDGGSNDTSIDIIKRYDQFIDYWISEKDTGMYDALNKGFMCAQGMLINFCNSDDLIYAQDTLSKIVNNFNQHLFDCCFGSTEYIDGFGNKLYAHYPLIFNLRYLLTLGMPFAQPTFFWTKELIHKVGIFDLKYKIASDYDLISRLLLKSNKSYRNNFYVSKFRKYGTSFGDKNTLIANKEVVSIKKELFNVIKPKFYLFFCFYDRLVQKAYNLLMKLIKIKRD